MSHKSNGKMMRRRFVQTAAAAPALFTIVPRHVLGGQGHVAPSDTFGGRSSAAAGRGRRRFAGCRRGTTCACSRSAT